MLRDIKPKTRLEVAIVGGGIGGLCLAIGLLKFPHIKIEIYEAAQAFSEIGAGVTVGPNARRALKLISPGAEQAFLSQATGNGPNFPADKNVFCRFIWGAGLKSGETIADAWCVDGQQSVHRAHFLTELVKLVPREITHFNKRLSTLEETSDGEVVMSFEDGTTAKADTVVGADGVHSVVRKHLISESHPSYNPTFSGAAAYRGLVPIEEARAAVGDAYLEVASLHCASGGFIMTYPVDFHKLWNIVAVDPEVQDWNGASVQPADLEKMIDKFASLGPIPRKIVSLLNKPDTKVWSLWEMFPLETFTWSRIVLMGDAAHATLPYQGQGAGQAVEDALVLSNLLGKTVSSDELRYALHAFDRIRRPRSQKVVRTSKQTGELLSLGMPGVLDDQEAFKAEVEDRYDWIFNRDMQLQVDQALMMVEETKIKALHTGQDQSCEQGLYVIKPVTSIDTAKDT